MVNNMIVEVEIRLKTTITPALRARLMLSLASSPSQSMASTSLSFRLPPSTSFKQLVNTQRRHSTVKIRCGPRDNRGQLQKGRSLSIEAIQAVQSLKRTFRSNPDDRRVPSTISRLIKADLIAVFKELLRQGHYDLALTVFSAIRLETWYKKPDLSVYADLVLSLSRDGMREEIDGLIRDLEAEVEESGAVDWMWEGSGKELVKLIKGLAAAGRKESIVRIYGLMKKCGWGCEEEGRVVEEYVAQVLARGLRRFGESDLADQVDSMYERYSHSLLQPRIRA